MVEARPHFGKVKKAVKKGVYTGKKAAGNNMSE